MSADLPASADVVVVGAGHNGLVAATLLARAGLQVVVCERADVLGGAARTEAPFPRVPGLRQSTGAYLLGLMPPELIRLLDIDIPVLRRDPHYFLPTTKGTHLLLGADAAANRAAIETAFSAADVKADDALAAELAALRDDIAPAWLTEPLSVEETAERYVRPALREPFVQLCRGSVADYLDRFGFTSDLLVAMYVVTDGLSGLHAGPDTPGSGHNFLVHNMCRLPGVGGTWMIVRGGMGTVTERIAAAARAAGATMHTTSPAEQVLVESGVVTGVVLAGDHEIRAPVVVGGCDPFRLAGPRWRRRCRAGSATGWTPYVDPAAPSRSTSPCATCRGSGVCPRARRRRSARRSTCCPTARGCSTRCARCGPTSKRAGCRTSRRSSGTCTRRSTRRCRTTPAITRARCSCSRCRTPPPARPGTQALPAYVEQLLAICDRFAPGTTDLVADTLALPPPAIETRFGITGGHIHHVDNGFAFADRVPYSWLPGLYAASAGCHPAGSVIGAAGHNAAQRVLTDLGLPAAR